MRWRDYSREREREEIEEEGLEREGLKVFVLAFSLK
jgi:hypothetical protein